MSCYPDIEEVDYTAGRIYFRFMPGDTVVLSFQFLDDDLSGLHGTNVPADLSACQISVRMMTPPTVLVATLSRDDANGIVHAQFDETATDALPDRSRYEYTVTLTDTAGREMTPVSGRVYIGGSNCDGC
jgi:hypothetical protein